MNVVQIVLESNSMEYYGRGFTPFLDSLRSESLTCDNSFANGRISIDAMASVLSAIPRLGESFMLTPAALNPISSAAGELGRHKSYHTAFFHGAQENSMGFKAYSLSAGYKEYYGRESSMEMMSILTDTGRSGMRNSCSFMRIRSVHSLSLLPQLSLLQPHTIPTLSLRSTRIDSLRVRCRSINAWLILICL